MAKLITLASTDPANERRMIRFAQAEDWFPGFDAAKLATAILSGIGDATPNGIELLNQTVSAKLIASGKGEAVQAYDPITGEHVPMQVQITVRVSRAPANEAEATRIEHAATTRKAKADERKAADAQASERTVVAMRDSFKEGFTTAVTRKAETSDVVKPLASQVRDAADLLSAIRDLTAPAKGLPAGTEK